MTPNDSTPHRDLIAFERAYPGVRALSVNIRPLSYEFECEGTPEALVAVGLITQVMRERMVGISSQVGFGPRPNNKANFCQYYTNLRFRTEKGRATNILTMRQYDGSADVVSFCRLLGVPEPAQAKIAAAVREKAAAEAAHATHLRQAYDTGCKVRRGDQKLWSSDGVLISVDWDELRSRVANLRRMGAL